MNWFGVVFNEMFTCLLEVVNGILSVGVHEISFEAKSLFIIESILKSKLNCWALLLGILHLVRKHKSVLELMFTILVIEDIKEFYGSF